MLITGRTDDGSWHPRAETSDASRAPLSRSSENWLGRCSKLWTGIFILVRYRGWAEWLFPDSLVHGAGGTLVARAFRHARISFASFRFENIGTSNHHLLGLA